MILSEESKGGVKMSKAVLISIRPEWCEKIVSGQKTIEVRKTRPKIATPFKCYIYQTKHRWVFSLLRTRFGKYALADRLESAFGMVIGEFVCDRLVKAECGQYCRLLSTLYTQILPQELFNYANYKPIYGWHISNLVIYDKPKELKEFSKYWDYFIDNQTPRPPRSWCYVEDIP